MIEKELRKPVEKNEKRMEKIKESTLRNFHGNSHSADLDEREKAIVACQIVKELQRLVMNYYTKK